MAVCIACYLTGEQLASGADGMNMVAFGFWLLRSIESSFIVV